MARPVILRPVHVPGTVRGVHPDLPLDRDDVNTMMGALFDLNAKADLILALLTEDGDDEEAEEEADPDS